MTTCDPGGSIQAHRGPAVAEVFEFKDEPGTRWRPVCLAHLVEHCTTARVYVWHALGDETPVRGYGEPGAAP